MKRILIALALAALPLLAAADGCVSQTYIINGKMIICDTCCYGGSCNTICF